MARIIITGSPGTGKSVIAESLALALGHRLIDIKKVVRAKKILGKNREVDVKKLSKALGFLKGRRDFIVEGHLACEARIPSDFIFVLRTEPKILEKRLAKRGYGRKKMDENLLAEMLDYCTQRARAVYRKGVLELDTSRRSVPSCVRIMMDAIKRKKKKLDEVNHSKTLMEYLRLGGSK